MVDTTINMVLKRLVPIIEKKVRDEVYLVLNSAQEAASLASKLKKIQEVLVDAERRSITDRKVEAWLEKIKEAAYEMDDALDEWEAKIVEMDQLEGSEDAASNGFMEKVSSFIQSLCLCFKHVVERRGIALTIKQLNGKLESIHTEIDDEFKFFPNVPREKDRDSHEIKRILTTSYFDVRDVSEIKGRDEEKNNIISKLLSMRSGDNDRLQVISIVGTGGLGKTTLAQLIFNDSAVKETFDKTIWVCVSDPFDEIRVANSIIKKLNENSQHEKDLQILLEGIETFAKKKRILLVLDDVWEHDERKWHQLRNSVTKGAPGTRILVTTRNIRVAESMGTTETIRLRQLSDEECWSLLSQIAFQGEGKEDPRKREIGWEIVKRCDGLPLAGKTLGSLLRTKHSVQEWKNVLESQIWELEKVKVDLFPHLYLSYNELRPAVKRCFSYCAKFPKDAEIDVNNLIRMWMAQGFLSNESADEMELKGREYVEDLLVCCFFEGLGKDLLGNVGYCKIHDIIHDFAKFLTKNECFVVESVDDIRKLESSFKNSRHLTWLDKVEFASPVSMHSTVQKLRSFRCGTSLPSHVLGNLQCVRELSLPDCELEEFPPEIGNLIHVRYLDLTDNPLRELPKSICSLYYLQTLMLGKCSNLSHLPEEIHKLTNLRHIYMSDGVFFPQGIEKLTCLKTLVSFRASRGGSKLGYLKNLKQLETLAIVIDDLNEESDVIEASKAQLKTKNGLQVLGLELKGEVSRDVMEALEPPPDLSFLGLGGYVGFEFPSWIVTSFHNLRSLSIENCSSLPPSETLQSLEELYIYNMKEMTCLDTDFWGITTVGTVAFPNLKKLQFYDCEEWTKWEDLDEEDVLNSMEIMPRLRELRVILCPRLEGLPHLLLRKISLEQLAISLSYTIIKQYKSGGGFKFLSPTCEVTV